LTSRTTAIPDRIRWTVGLLEIRPTDHLLEIGCGPGHAVSLVCARLTRGTITAIDHSAIQVARARERNRECVASGRACIEHVTLAELDVGARRFHTIFAVNVNAFWTTPATAVESLLRLLRPDGVVYLAYEPPSERRLHEIGERLPPILRGHGVAVEDIRVQAFRKSHGICIIGRPS
jgi:SAM-dependent methyltransferase